MGGCTASQAHQPSLLGYRDRRLSCGAAPARSPVASFAEAGARQTLRQRAAQPLVSDPAGQRLAQHHAQNLHALASVALGHSGVGLLYPHDGARSLMSKQADVWQQHNLQQQAETEDGVDMDMGRFLPYLDAESRSGGVASTSVWSAPQATMRLGALHRTRRKGSPAVVRLSIRRKAAGRTVVAPAAPGSVFGVGMDDGLAAVFAMFNGSELGEGCMDGASSLASQPNAEVGVSSSVLSHHSINNGNGSSGSYCCSRLADGAHSNGVGRSQGHGLRVNSSGAGATGSLGNGGEQPWAGATASSSINSGSSAASIKKSLRKKEGRKRWRENKRRRREAETGSTGGKVQTQDQGESSPASATRAASSRATTAAAVPVECTPETVSEPAVSSARTKQEKRKAEKMKGSSRGGSRTQDQGDGRVESVTPPAASAAAALSQRPPGTASQPGAALPVAQPVSPAEAAQPQALPPPSGGAVRDSSPVTATLPDSNSCTAVPVVAAGAEPAACASDAVAPPTPAAATSVSPPRHTAQAAAGKAPQSIAPPVKKVRVLPRDAPEDYRFPRSPKREEHAMRQRLADERRRLLAPREPTDQDLQLTARVADAAHWREVLALVLQHRRRLEEQQRALAEGAAAGLQAQQLTQALPLHAQAPGPGQERVQLQQGWQGQAHLLVSAIAGGSGPQPQAPQHLHPPPHARQHPHMQHMGQPLPHVPLSASPHLSGRQQQQQQQPCPVGIPGQPPPRGAPVWPAAGPAAPSATGPHGRHPDSTGSLPPFPPPIQPGVPTTGAAAAAVTAGATASATAAARSVLPPSAPGPGSPPAISALPFTPQHVAAILQRTAHLLALTAGPASWEEARRLYGMVDALARMAAVMLESPGMQLREIAVVLYSLARLRRPVDKPFLMLFMNAARKRFCLRPIGQGAWGLPPQPKPPKPGTQLPKQHQGKRKGKGAAVRHSNDTDVSLSDIPGQSVPAERPPSTSAAAAPPTASSGADSAIVTGPAYTGSLPYSAHDMVLLLWSVRRFGVERLRDDWAEAYGKALLRVVPELTGLGVGVVLHSLARLKSPPSPEVVAALCSHLVALIRHDLSGGVEGPAGAAAAAAAAGSDGGEEAAGAQHGGAVDGLQGCSAAAGQRAGVQGEAAHRALGIRQEQAGRQSAGGEQSRGQGSELGKGPADTGHGEDQAASTHQHVAGQDGGQGTSAKERRCKLSADEQQLRQGTDRQDSCARSAEAAPAPDNTAGPCISQAPPNVPGHRPTQSEPTSGSIGNGELQDPWVVASDSTSSLAPLDNQIPGPSPETPRRRCRPTDVSMTLWAVATLRLPPGTHCPDLLPAVEFYSLHYLPDFPEQELSNLVWALARLQHTPGPEWMVCLHAVVAAQLSQLRQPQALATLLYGLAEMRQRPEPQWLEAAAGRALELLPWFTPQGLALTVHSLAKMGYRPQHSWLVAFHARLESYKDLVDTRVRDKVREAYQLLGFRPGARPAQPSPPPPAHWQSAPGSSRPGAAAGGVHGAPGRAATAAARSAGLLGGAREGEVLEAPPSRWHTSKRDQGQQDRSSLQQGSQAGAAARQAAGDGQMWELGGDGVGGANGDSWDVRRDSADDIEMQVLVRPSRFVY